MSKVTVKPGVNLPSEAILRLLRTAERLKVSLIVIPEVIPNDWYAPGWPALVEDPNDD